MNVRRSIVDAINRNFDWIEEWGLVILTAMFFIAVVAGLALAVVAVVMAVVS